MVKPVGFDQKIMLHHLDFTENEARKLSRKEMYEALDYFCEVIFKGRSLEKRHHDVNENLVFSRRRNYSITRQST